MAIVPAYDKATGEKVRVPAHWIGHPVWGRGLNKTPRSKRVTAAPVAESSPADGETTKKENSDA